MVQLITRALFDQVAAGAAASPRKRLNYNFHSGPDDNPHRFLNVLLPGTYVRPHRHLNPPKAETFLVLEGTAAVLLFNDSGEVTERFELSDASDGVLGIDISPGVWHTIIALSERVVCFEVKPGPWEPSSDKEYASWAPVEGESCVDAYVKFLTSSQIDVKSIEQGTFE